MVRPEVARRAARDLMRAAPGIERGAVERRSSLVTPQCSNVDFLGAFRARCSLTVALLAESQWLHTTFSLLASERLMVTHKDEILCLRDGRVLAYAEYGDPDGCPVMLFHGNPSSRLSWGLIPGSPFRPHLWLIAPDRPGFGRSDFQPGRQLLDWPDDVCELADALGLHRFAVLGVSGGGPATLACAWKIPDRMTAVGVVSSPCPMDVPGATEGMSRTNRTLFFLTRHAPPLVRLNMLFLAYLARQDRLVERLVYKMADVDKAMVERPEIRDYLAGGFAEALRQGGAGSARELVINHGQPWGFALEDIKIGVHLWQGEEDPSVPPAMGRYLAQTVPNCKATFIPGAGHLWILDHMGEVLEALVPVREKTADP